MNSSTSIAHKARTVARLGSQQRSLLFEAWILLTIMEPALHILRLRRIEKWLVNTSASISDRKRGLSPSQIGVIVERAAKVSPARPHCLAIAIVAHYLLRQEGFESTIKIGVSKPSGADFAAHSWVEADETVIVGHHQDLKDFRSIHTLGAKK